MASRKKVQNHNQAGMLSPFREIKLILPKEVYFALKLITIKNEISEVELITEFIKRLSHEDSSAMKILNEYVTQLASDKYLSQTFLSAAKERKLMQTAPKTKDDHNILYSMIGDIE